MLSLPYCGHSTARTLTCEEATPRQNSRGDEVGEDYSTSRQGDLLKEFDRSANRVRACLCRALVKGLADTKVSRTFINRSTLKAAWQFLPFVGYGIYIGKKLQ